MTVDLPVKKVERVTKESRTLYNLAKNKYLDGS